MISGSIYGLSKNPKVSVIVPFRGFNERVADCLKSLKKQKYRNMEIVTISDYAKIDEVKIGGVKHVFNPKLNGVGKKRNAGVAASKGEILFFLDSDCVAPRGTISKLVHMFQNVYTDAITCIPLAPKEGKLVDLVTLLEYEDRYRRVGENFVSVAATTCFGVKKKAFKAVGGFKDYTTGEATGEDWDFSMRFSKKGFKIFHTNKIGVVHNHVSKNIWNYLKRQYMHARYRVTFSRKYGRITDEYASSGMFVTSTLLLSVPVAARMRKKMRCRDLFALPGVAFLRNFAWTIGFIDGYLFE